ncbi:SDR family oxidoreductase [Streptomyces sp. NPDC056452]|uniref:SDR family oxidoreductase n=1 Tax=Streptomyces sp. NPDC056452 TaxID=3345821 RepID=UPI0036A796C8
MRTLIVGSGFVGRALAHDAVRSGGTALLASRNPPEARDDGLPPPDWTRLDITEPGAFRSVLGRSGADAVVLVHGPSDVTWCTQHPDAAMAGHADAATEVVEAAGDRRVVLISTDNVFDGASGTPDETTPTRPGNTYGRAKLAAEKIVSDAADATVLRVSLIYGWEPATVPKWLNFFASCVHKLRAGLPVEAPFDQWTTPVLLDDVVTVTAALTLADSVPPLLHLGGPEEISRADWAAVIAAGLGVPGDLVVPVPRAGGRYADRPARSCLASGLLSVHPSTAGLTVRGVREGTRVLLEQAARTAGR